jgi:hypothetical protein
MSINTSKSRMVGLAISAFAAAAAFAINGCGGTTTKGANLVPVPSAGPSIEGLQPLAFVRGNGVYEVSGFGSPSNSTMAYDTGGISYTDNGLPPIDVADGNPFPLGFAPGGAFVNSPPYGAALAPGQQVIFRAAIATGQNGKTNQVINLNPASVVLTSPEDPGFSEPLTFSDDIYGTTSPLTGPLANGTYTTNAFTLPFATTGLHTVTCSCADVAGNTAATTFQSLVLASNAAAVLVQVIDSNLNPLPGVAVSTTSALPGVTAYGASAGDPEVSVTDSNGVGIVFVTANPKIASTVAVTASGQDTVPGSTGPVSGSLGTVSVLGGQVTETVESGTSPAPTPLQITATAPASSLRVRTARR